MLKTKYILLKNPKILKILVSVHINSDGRKSFDGRGKFQNSNQMVKTKYIFLKNPKILKILVLLIQMEEKVFIGKENSQNT